MAAGHRFAGHRLHAAGIGAVGIATTLLLLPLFAVSQTPAILASAAAMAAPLRSTSGQLLGLVTDAAGHPEAGALVQVQPDGLHRAPWRRLTTAEGLFSLADLPPGTYYVDVGKGARVAGRRQVQIHASERALLLVNLPRLAQLQFGPAGAVADQQFGWALRQAGAWRPVFRLDSPAPAPPSSDDPPPVEGYVALTAGGDAGPFSSPAMATDFRLDTSLWAGAQMSLSGDIGANGEGIYGGDSRLQASLHSSDPGNQSVFVMAIRQVSLPLSSLPALRVVSLNYADGLNLGSRLRLQYGALFNTVTMTDSAHTFDPYFRASYQLGPHGQLEYRIASAVPPLHFNRDNADMPDPTPEVTLQDNRARIESAHHQEVRYTDALTPNDTVSVAMFGDQFQRTAVDGAYADAAQLGAADLLPNLLNNMFVGNGGDYGGWGYRVVYERRLGDHWSADLAYAEGAVLAAQTNQWQGQLAAALGSARDQAWTAKLSGTTPLTHTHLICSYRALDHPAVTGIDLYDDSDAQADSYANVFLRQPLPSVIGGGRHVEALVEFHNLLAQGYVPMLGSDGHTLYLVQTVRAVRGGLSISF